MQLFFVSKFRLFLCVLLVGYVSASAQPDYDLPLVKPKKYENKLLRSEKSDQKKFTLPRKVYQNLTTRYNFYYNANNKLSAILEKAKAYHQDDFTQLLPFYNYTTAITAADSAELDSVIYKATAAIVLHDLRNGYIDDMYLLIGKSYFYWQKFDSAYRIFQFINYNFFPKSKDEYVIVVGSNEHAVNGNLAIATKEKNGLLHRAFSKPPSRNDALLWLARTYAEDNLFSETYSLVNLLKADPAFPRRLHSKLNEVQAYSFYKQQHWDSAAYYLKNALSVATNKTELARWEYLLAQLYAKNNQPSLASEYYTKAKVHTSNPVLYIYARIYEAQLIKNNNPAENNVDEVIADLLKLSKKERFDGYEDVLFYAASTAALQKGDTAQAIYLLKRSVAYQSENLSVKNLAYVKLFELEYGRKEYASSSAMLDSVNLKDPLLLNNASDLQSKQPMLKELVSLITVVKQQDSLQAVAKMPEKEMNSYLRSIARKLRKQRGLKEDLAYSTVVDANYTKNDNIPLFSNTDVGSGWYFYNTSQKAKGLAMYKANWGNRPNVDNWRRQNAIDAAITPANSVGENNVSTENEAVVDFNNMPSEDLNVEGLKQFLPITSEKLIASNKKIAESLFQQGQIYKNQLEDYAQAIVVFEEIRMRFSQYEKEEEVLFELFYCYNKVGNRQKASLCQQELKKNYPKSEFLQKITNALNATTLGSDPKTIAYESIYELFISGNFNEAMRQKKIADSTYGNSYWTPQLLYIESLYYLKQKNDSAAILTFSNIEQRFPGSPMAERAAIMKDVVNRRKEIEAYLVNANIVRETEDSIVTPVVEPVQLNKIAVENKQYKTDKIAANTLPNQNNTNLTKPVAPVEKTSLDKPTRDNTVKPVNPIKPAKETSIIKPVVPSKVEETYTYNSNEPYTVLLYFNEVDPVYISEAKNAFQRYNKASHSGEAIELNVNDAYKETLWLEMGYFSEVTIALGYMNEWKNNVRQIIPWLNGSKYHFIIISKHNLEILKTRKRMDEYKRFLNQFITEKFE